MTQDRRRSARLTAFITGIAAVIVLGSVPWASVQVSGSEPEIHRLGGPDRYATAARISNYLFPTGAPVV